MVIAVNNLFLVVHTVQLHHFHFLDPNGSVDSKIHDVLQYIQSVFLLVGGADPVLLPDCYACYSQQRRLVNEDGNFSVYRSRIIFHSTFHTCGFLFS